MIKILNEQSISSELDEIITIHQDIFKDDLSSNFGKNYLIKFYQNIIKNQNGYFLIEISDHLVQGFILFTTKPFSLQNHIRLREILLFGIRVLCKPILLLKLISRLTEKKRDIGINEVSFFAIRKEFQSKGLGSQLLHELKNICVHEKINHIYTYTSNIKLKEYYIKKHNAKLIYTNSFLGFNSHYIEIPTTNLTFK